MHYLIAALIGLMSGITSGLFGVGGGVIMVPAMFFLMQPEIKGIKMAIGTSLAVIIPTAVIGSFKHAQHQNIHWPTVLALVPTAMAGGYLGVWLCTKINADDLKRFFGGFLVLVGLRLVLFK